MRKSKPHLPPRYERGPDDFENEVEGFHRIMHVEPPFRDCTLERPVLEPIRTSEYRPLGWLWKDKIPLNRLTLIEGPPAVGKLFVALDIAARATRGELGVEQEIIRLREVSAARSKAQTAALNAKAKAAQEAARERAAQAAGVTGEGQPAGHEDKETGRGGDKENGGEARNPNDECLRKSEIRNSKSEIPHPQSGRTVRYVTPADYVPPPEKPVVVICDQWDAEDTLLPRLESLGADVDKVGKFTQVHTSDLCCGSKDFRNTSFPLDCAMFAYVLRQHPRCRLIVIDNLENYCESPRRLREAIKELDEAAMGHQVTIVATIQSNVRVTKEGAICDTSRKTDGLARSIWCITPDPSRPGLMRMEPRRMAFCKKPAGIAFRINEPGKIDWEPLPPYERPPTDAATRKKLKHTRMLTWLAATLGTGVVPAEVIYDAGAEQGFSKAKLIEAREELGARTFKEGFGKSGGWLWTRKPASEVADTEICDALSKELNDEGDAVRRAAVSNATQSVPTGVPTQSVGTRNFRALNEKQPKKNGSGPHHKNGNGEKHPPLYDPEITRILAQRRENEILSRSKRSGEKSEDRGPKSEERGEKGDFGGEKPDFGCP